MKIKIIASNEKGKRALKDWCAANVTLMGRMIRLGARIVHVNDAPYTIEYSQKILERIPLNTPQGKIMKNSLVQAVQDALKQYNDVKINHDYKVQLL